MGALADRISRRNLVAVGILVWSVMTSLSSIARSFFSLAVARTGVGIGEATLSPSAFSMITDSFPKQRLSGAMSIYTLLPGLLNDHLFHDELRIGASISITVVLATVVGLGAGLATLAPYRRDYQIVHA